jgi:hypothetical protein
MNSTKKPKKSIEDKIKIAVQSSAESDPAEIIKYENGVVEVIKDSFYANELSNLIKVARNNKYLYYITAVYIHYSPNGFSGFSDEYGVAIVEQPLIAPKLKFRMFGRENKSL